MNNKAKPSLQAGGEGGSTIQSVHISPLLEISGTPSNTPVEPTNSPAVTNSPAAPPSLTNTPGGDTPTNTPIGGGDTPTNTPIGGGDTPTNTPAEGGDTPTGVPTGGGDTPTNTPIGGGGDTPTNSPIGGGDTPTSTPIGGGADTPTNTPIGGGSTPTVTATFTPTNTQWPTPTNTDEPWWPPEPTPTAPQGITGWVDIAMDGDRDTFISFHDPDDQEYLFWVNDDRDVRKLDLTPFEWMYFEDDVDVNGHPDCDDDRIGTDNHLSITGCRRDLEDFTRLQILIDQDLVGFSDVTFHLRFANTSGTAPEVNLFLAETEGTEYLTAGEVADNQKEVPRLMTVGGTEVEIPNSIIRANPVAICFLLEGKSAGQGELTIIARHNGQEIDRESVHLELRPIESFYELFRIQTVGGDSLPVGTYNDDFTETDDYLLIIHGFNMTLYQKRCFAATAFKRLWWQGYQGHVGLFDWPCVAMSIWDWNCYNDSDFNARRCGQALANRLNNLNSGEHAGLVRVLAHSQGNVITGEALRIAPANTLHTYIASQAAIAADCYQAGLPENHGSASTPNLRADYPPTGSAYLSQVQWMVSARFNYFNPYDYALVTGYVNSGIGSWECNNRLKPVQGFDYEGLPDSWGQLSRFYRYHLYHPEFPPDAPIEKIEDGDMLFPDEIHEIFSYADEARSQALGAMGNVTGFSVATRNLYDIYGYDNTRPSHSRQFLSNVVEEDPYWYNLLEDAEMHTSNPPRQ